MPAIETTGGDTDRHPAAIVTEDTTPMNALTLTLIRLAFLAILWLFVIAAVGVVRTDLFGPSTSARQQRRQRKAQRVKPPRPPRAGRPSRGIPQRLLVTGGALAGTTLGLSDQQITIGRANDATLVLNDDYASSRHARLFPQDGQWIVEDLGSTNGTYLDRQKVTQPTPVPPGVPIRIGKTVLELRR
jgi:Inner membrane component of T3SS, cytoplasmic domain